MSNNLYNQHQDDRFDPAQRAPSQSDTQLLHDVLSLCRTTMENVQNAETQAEANQRAIDTAMREMRNVARSLNQANSDKSDGENQQVLDALARNERAAKELSDDMTQRQKALEQAFISMADRLDGFEKKFDAVMSKLSAIETQIETTSSRSSTDTKRIGDSVSEVVAKLQDTGAKLDESGRAQLTAINLVANGFAKMREQDVGRQAHIEDATNKISARLDELLRRPEKEHAALITASMEIVRNISELSHILKDVNQTSLDTTAKIDGLPEKLQREVAKLSYMDEQRGDATREAADEKLEALRKILLEISDRIDGYSGQTMMEIETITNKVDGVVTTLSEPDLMAEKIEQIVQGQIGVSEKLSQIGKAHAEELQCVIEQLKAVAERDNDEIFGDQKSEFEALCQSFHALSADVEKQSTGLRQAVLAVHNESEKLGDKIQIDLKANEVDLSPTLNAMEKLAAKVEQSADDVAQKATAALGRVEELESRRMDYAKDISQAEKESLNRMFVGFRLILERLDKGANDFNSLVEGLKATEMPESGAASSEENMCRLEALSSALSEAVAAIEPATVEAVKAAVLAKMPEQQSTETPQLLSHLMLGSISKVNLICADLQLALDEVKQGQDGDDAKILEDVAKRTKMHASEMTDVVAVLQQDLQKIIAMEEGTEV